MTQKFDNLLSLLDYFKDEKTCEEYLEKQRWNDCVRCIWCGSNKVNKIKSVRRFKCYNCREQFSAKVGTIYEATKIPLRKWFIALYLITAHKKGISSYQLARDIKVTQKTAWFMLQRIRFQMGMDNDINEQLEGTVECDETFVGGKNKNRHAKKKVKYVQGHKRTFKDKTPILGLMQRGGKIKTRVLPSVSYESIAPIVKKVVKYGSKLCTDDWAAYNSMGIYYQHHVIDHSKRQYVDGDDHTNGIESFWSQIKRMIIGVYHRVSPKHLQKYANEATFRFNTRLMTEYERMNYILSLNAGSLRYKTLVR